MVDYLKKFEKALKVARSQQNDTEKLIKKYDKRITETVKAKKKTKDIEIAISNILSQLLQEYITSEIEFETQIVNVIKED